MSLVLCTILHIQLQVTEISYIAVIRDSLPSSVFTDLSGVISSNKK